MPTRFKVTTRDRGRRKLDATIAELKKKPGVTVGIHAAEGAKEHEQKDPNAEPETILQIAVANEFGLGPPERSFIRAWFDLAREQNYELATRMLKSVVKGQMTATVALERLGAKFVGDIQRRMAQHIDPPNAPSTVAAKGSSTPLIDKGAMRQAITYQVREKK